MNLHENDRESAEIRLKCRLFPGHSHSSRAGLGVRRNHVSIGQFRDIFVRLEEGVAQWEIPVAVSSYWRENVRI